MLYTRIHIARTILTLTLTSLHPIIPPHELSGEVDSGYLCFQFVFFLGIAVFLSCLLVVVAVNLEVSE